MRTSFENNVAMRMFACGFLLSLVFLHYARCAEPGGWLHEVTQEVQTPHLDWAQNLSGGPLRVLFVTCSGGGLHYQQPRLGARIIVEWAQRMDMVYEAVTAGRGLAKDSKYPRLGFDLYHPNGYEGVHPDEKEAELAHKRALHPYELYVFNHISFDALVPEAQLQIMEAVHDGAGLVLIGDVHTDLSEMFKAPSSKLAKEILRLARLPKSRAGVASQKRNVRGVYKQDHIPLRTYAFGEGRIVQVTRAYEPNNTSCLFMPERIHAFQQKREDQKKSIRYYNEAPIPLWWGEFETLQADFLRLFYYAAGRRAQVAISCPSLITNPVIDASVQTIPLVLENPERKKGTIVCRIRNDENNILQELSIPFDNLAVNIPIPTLAGGQYFLDIRSKINGKTDDFGVLLFRMQPKVQAIIEMPDDRIQDHSPIRFTMTLSSPLKDARAVITLADSPYDRVWARRSIPLPEKTKHTLELADWFLPNAAATLRIEVMQGENTLGYARKTVFRPQGNRIPPWMDLLWGESLTPLHGLMNQARQGWGGITRAVNGCDGTNVQQYMITGEICIPWGPLSNWQVFNRQHGRSVGYCRDPQTGETKPNWTLYEGGAKTFGASEAEIDKLDSMPSMMPERPAAVREVLRIWNRNLNAHRYGIQAFNLGDETMPGYDTFHGAYATREFHSFLQRSYQTIDRLNKAWNRSYANFSQIPLLSTNDAIAQNMLPEGAAQRLFAETNYYDVYRTIGTSIQKEMPLAYYGPTSSEFLSGIASAEINASFAHPDTTLIELRRTMHPESFSLPLFGYDIRQKAYSNKRFWQSVLYGNARGHTWFAANIYPEGGTLCADFRDKMPNVTATRLFLQEGVGPLIRSLRPATGQIAVLSSTASDMAHRLAPSFVSPASHTTEPLFKYCYARGIGIDLWATDVLATMLPRYPVLVLPGLSAVSAEDAQRIVQFVENGGTVIADLNPGLYNEHIALHDTNPFEALFGNLTPRSIHDVCTYKNLQVSGVAGLPVMQERKYGKGHAILLNTSLTDFVRAYSDPEKFNLFMDTFLSRLKVDPPVMVKGLLTGSLIRMFHGDGFDMLAMANDILSARGEGGGSITVSVPRTGYFYRVGYGFVGEGKSATLPFDPPFCLLTRFTEKQTEPLLRMSSQTVSPGDSLSVDLSGLPRNRVFCLQMRDPNGRLLRPRNESHVHELISTEKDRNAFPVHFSYNDPEGKYKLTLTDVATGLSATTTVFLKKDG